MSTWNWSPFLIGGATRPDALSGMNPGFASSLQNMFSNAPPEIQQHLRMTSGFRSPERQQQLWDEALVKYGSEAEARKWVAPPGRSHHNHGTAADLKYLDPVAQKWAHDNAAQYGLHFPLANEPWHVEPMGSRDNPPGLMAQVTEQTPHPGLMGAITQGAEPTAPPETLKLFGWDTGVDQSKLQALADMQQPQQPMAQAPQIRTGPGYVKKTDGLARALEAFQATQAKRRA